MSKPQHYKFADNPPGKIDFSRSFCITGEFAFGERPEVWGAIEALGGTIVRNPTNDCITVIGLRGSEDWVGGICGRKIESAVQKRAKGLPVLIVTETEWIRQVNECMERLEARGDMPTLVALQDQIEDIKARRSALELEENETRKKLAKLVSKTTWKAKIQAQKTNAADINALELLEQITLTTSSSKRVLRGDRLLACPGSTPSPRQNPHDWPEGWCRGWAYAVPPSMAPALDIQLTDRIQDKMPIRVWTQGSAFAFQTGYCIHDVPLPPGKSPLWRDALQVVNQTICILKASPAIPATDGVPRNPGLVYFHILRTTADRKRQEKGKPQSMTQDKFIKMLICDSER
ncbi:MAG: hypothetical protein AB7E32_14105 [Desulfovibrio sp.]